MLQNHKKKKTIGRPFFKKKTPCVQRVEYNEKERDDFLTGFHKRKVERRKNAEIQKKEKARLEKIEERKRIKEQRMAEYEERLRINDSNQFLDNPSSQNSSDFENYSDWNGFDSDNDFHTHASPNQFCSDSSTTFTEGLSSHPKKSIVKVEYLNSDSLISLLDSNSESKTSSNKVDDNKSNEVLKNSLKKAKEHAQMCGLVKRPLLSKKFRYLTRKERDSRNRIIKNKKKSKILKKRSN